jgi:subtilisin-like proprotein convertase family protein
MFWVIVEGFRSGPWDSLWFVDLAVENMPSALPICRKRRRGLGRAGMDLRLEALESRVLLSGASAWVSAPSKNYVRKNVAVAHTTAIMQAFGPAYTSPPAGALTPTQVRSAYGIDQVMFGSVVGDGSGQTVAIVDAYHYPTAMADLQAFDAAMGLPDLQAWSGTGNTGAWLRVVSQRGGTDYPSTDPNGPGSSLGTWEMEEALDIQWVHAIAPGANIILVEADSNLQSDLLTAAVGWARQQTGVAAISMSFSGSEFPTESSFDYLFTTPSGHTGITFLAATGDSGTPSGYPAYSPNVVAVGGTTLSVSGNTYVSESAWSGSGGGISQYENQPSYQTGVVTQSTTKRTNPDVAMDADPASGVPIYDSWDWPDSPWRVFGGTSLATPMWAGIMAIIDQGRLLNGLPALDGATQTLPRLYTLPSNDFHDITTGNNGLPAGPGYDLVTGLGSPVGNLLIADMALQPSTAPSSVTLIPASDTGVSNTDGITANDNSSPAKALTFTVGGTIVGATVRVYANGIMIGSALATGATTNVTSNGTYTLASGSFSVTARQSLPGFGASPATSALTVKIDTTPPAVIAQSPSSSVTGSLSDLKFTFNEAVDTTSFSVAADIASFTGPSGNDLSGQITGYTWSSGNTVLDVLINSQSAVGTYQLILGPQILDLAGNMMAAAYAGSFTIAATIYSANMDTNPGWTFTGGSAWAWGVPTGTASHNNDPTSGHTGSNVVGYNLSGDYAKNIVAYYATTPAIDCTQYQGLRFSFWRWLGVGFSATAAVQASSDGGSTWTSLYTNGGIVQDTSWTLLNYVLPSSFNGKSAVKFRWVMGPTGNLSTYPGWNIDDVTLTGSVIPPPSINGQVFVDANGNGTLDTGEAGLTGVAVFLDSNNNGVLDTGSTYSFMSTNVPLNIPDNNVVGATSVLTAAGTSGVIATVRISFNITHQYDGDLSGYLIGPDSTQITLFSHVGGSGQNFSNTTLSDSATSSISSGAAPFAGTYSPSPGVLSAFAGKSADGTWQFKVVDSSAGDVGTINSWSLSIVMAGEPTTSTDANGYYHFIVSAGTYTVREIVPSAYIAVTGASQSVTATTTVTGKNFADFPTTFTASTGSYYVTASGGILQISAGNAPLAVPTYQIAASLLPSLTFNFTGVDQTLFADFTGGALGVNLTLNAVSGNNDTLTVLGQGTGQTFTMTDYQIGLAAGGGAILYNNVDTVDLLNSKVYYSGALATIQHLIVDSGCWLVWG